MWNRVRLLASSQYLIDKNELLGNDAQSYVERPEMAVTRIEGPFRQAEAKDNSLSLALISV